MAMNAVRVGIDIEQASMVGAQIKTGRQGHTLMAVSARALPDGLMFEGEVVDVEGLAAELKTFWKAAGFTGKRFSVGIANQKIVVRTMEFPHHRPQGTARRDRVPGAGGHPHPARRSDPGLPGPLDDPGRGRGRRASAGPHRGRAARHDRPVHAGRQEGRPHDRRHRPSGLRAHALRRAAGRLRRPGRAAGGRSERAHQHRRRHQQHRRRVRWHAAVHARRQPGLRDAGPGGHAESRPHAIRRPTSCASPSASAAAPRRRPTSRRSR